jgi:hypothetical protein
MVILFRTLFGLFAVLFLLSLMSIGRSVVRGRWRSVRRGLLLLLSLVAVYGVFWTATTIALPLQIIPLNDPQFSGDWSISVTSVRRVPHDLDEDYELDFRMGNRGKSTLYGEKNLIVYLVTEDGTRYYPARHPSSPPFDAPVNPGRFVTTTRRFVMPTNLNRVQMVIKHEGFEWSWLVIGRSPFDGHTVVTIQ